MIKNLLQFLGFGQPKLKYLSLIYKVLEQGDYTPKIESYGKIEIVNFSVGVIDVLVSYNREFKVIHASFIHAKSQVSLGQYEKAFARPNAVGLLDWWGGIISDVHPKFDKINYLEGLLALDYHENTSK